MNCIAFASREVLERIFSHSTALDDLFEMKQRTAYYSGEFLERAVKRDAEVKGSRQNRKAITKVCRGWRNAGLKFFCELLVVDAKSPETWGHVDQTLKRFSLARHVRRLDFNAFDSSAVRLKNAIRILKQCKNVKYMTLTFPDDTRTRLEVGQTLLYLVRHASASSLQYLRCNFGNSFSQASLICKLADYPNLQTLDLRSAFGLESLTYLEPVQMLHLRKLRLTTTRDECLDYLSECDIPALEELSIVRLHSVTGGNQRFFYRHGYKLRCLELTFAVEGVSSLLQFCPYLEEIVLSLDGFKLGSGRGYLLEHCKVRRVGIRDIGINSLTVRKTMAVLDNLMQNLTSSEPESFPSLRTIRLLDFHRALWQNSRWSRCHVELWGEWIKKCEDMLIVLQASDGKKVSTSEAEKIRLQNPNLDNWLSMKEIMNQEVS